MQLASSIDVCNESVIGGWIYDADAPQQRFRLEVFAGGVAIGECSADLYREDLAAAKISDGTIAFMFEMPGFLPQSALEDIRLRIVGTDLFLLGQPPAPPKQAEAAVAPTLSRFGGLWIDRADFIDQLGYKHRNGMIDDELATQLFQFARDGYLIMPGAVAPEVVAALNTDIERIWTRPPKTALIETFEPDGTIKYILPDRNYREGKTKLLDLFTYSKPAQRATTAPAVTRFLAAIFEDTPKAFQQLNFWRGSQQAMHKDTAYVKIDSNPLSLAATWLALEDVIPGNGELEYYIGSHRAPEFLFGGVSKWVEGFIDEHDAFLKSLHDDAEKYGHRRAAFHAKAGDLLIWHADLAHGGTPITDPKATRRSLVTHFTGAKETPFYRRNSTFTGKAGDNCVFVSQYANVI